MKGKQKGKKDAADAPAANRGGTSPSLQSKIKPDLNK
jgi:hypothetical protein